MRFSAIDLTHLAAPDIIEALDYETILAALKTDFVARVPDFDVTMLEVDPAIKILEVAAYRELLLRALINDKLRAILLSAAKGNDLDQLGVYYGTARHVITAATEFLPAVMESDDAFRARIQLAPEAFSVAGPIGAYQYHAMNANPTDIMEVGAYGYADGLPQGRINIYVLARAGDGTAGSLLLDQVRSYLKAGKDKLPATDIVSVLSAIIVPYAINVTLQLPQGHGSTAITASATAQLTALAAARHKVGAGVPRAAVSKAALVDGVANVIVNSPVADILPAMGAAPRCSGITVSVEALA